MPGNVALASPATVMPYTLCSAYQETHEQVQTVAGPYADGRVQAATLTTLPRKTWDLTGVMPFADFEDLLTFYADRRGPHEPFYFYPLRDDYDETGVSTTGRYTVRFDSAFIRSHRLARDSVMFRLIEVQ